MKIVLILFLFGCSYLFSQPQTISIKLKEKNLPFGLKEYVPEQFPEVALALSGGGARGLSQIGVLKALIEAEVPIDIIVGTSMGSIVGGLYAAGYSVRELDSIAVNTDWNDLLSLDQQSDRTELFVDEKVTQDRAVFSLRLDGLNPVLPTSFIDGQKLSNYLNILAFSAPVHSLRSFDDFKVIFRAISTNLVTGEPVVIKDGPLGKALRASSSVSFFLPPVKLDSLILVDGGLTANIPVEFAKQAGGDFVIAVNTTSPLHKMEELSIPWKIADQVVSIPMKHINNDELHLADLIIEPEIGKTESTDFDSIRFLIDAGYESVINKIDIIMSELNSLYAANLRKNEFFLYNVKLEGEYTEEEKEIFQILETTDSVSSAAILYSLNQLYNTGEFDSLSFNIRKEEKLTYLKLNRYYRPYISNLTLSGISYNSTIEGTGNSPINRYCNPKIISEWLMTYLRDQRKKGFAIKEVTNIEIEDSCTLVINTTEGTINSIEIEGNTLTKNNVILREFPLTEGDYFTIEGIEKGLRNLRGTRLFEDIDFFIKRKNGGDAVVIRVEEKESGLLRFGFRVDNEYKAQFGLDIRDENLFGTGAELGAIFFGGTRSRFYMLEHKSNRIFDTYLTYKINAFYKFVDVIEYKEVPTELDRTFSRIADGEYRQIFYGTSVSVGSQVGKFGNLIFEGKYQVDEIKNIDGDPIDPYDIKLFTIKASSTIDTQDKYPYPENGLFFNASYETAQSFLGGDLGFTKVYFEYQNYFRVSKKHVFSPKIILGFADKTLPLSEQFSLGGQSSFYGMREYEFRGRQIFLASLMYRYKFPFQVFFDTYLKLRYDLGSTWREQEEIRFKDLRHGIGAELSFDTPIGPAEFAVGRSFLFIKDLPENPVSWGDVKFYFSIGYYY